MEPSRTTTDAPATVNRVVTIGTAAIEMLAVGALAVYSAYCHYWQVVVVAVGYIAYAAFKLWYDRRRSEASLDADGQAGSEPNKEERQTLPATRKNEHRLIKSSPNQRKLAGVLALVYAALMALGFYLESIRIEDRWPLWLLWTGGVAGFTAVIVLPFAVVVLFFGIDVSFLRRFTLRGMLRGMFWASLLFWYSTQMFWIIQRQNWRAWNRAAVTSTEGQAPPALRLLREQGASRIEIKNATKKQLSEAKRLFPEATVIAAEKSADGAQPAPAAVPGQKPPAGGN